MPTLDQLSEEKRAIIELVLSRGQSYDDLAEMLAMPAARVREHAREALVALAPRSAEGVDPHWRGQVADYLLGQQSGPEAKATRAHLKSSEPARTWALSTLDTLGELYANGSEPFIPAGGRAPKEAPAAPSAPAPTATRPAPRGEALSPEAQVALRRRRIGALAAAVAVAIIAIVAVVLLSGGDEAPAPEVAAPTETSAEPIAIPPEGGALALELAPVDGQNAAGQALLAQQQGQSLLIVQAKLPPSGRDEAYEVWLYNDQDDAVPVGAQITDKRGNFQGAGPLPANYQDYRFVDVSLEEARSDQEHSGDSALRGELASAQETQLPGGAAPGAAPGGATPTAPAP